jgi:hypothetical protein
MNENTIRINAEDWIGVFVTTFKNDYREETIHFPYPLSEEEYKEKLISCEDKGMGCGLHRDQLKDLIELLNKIYENEEYWKEE